MRMPSSLAKLGLEAVSSTKVPGCIGVRCMSTPQAATAAPRLHALPSSLAEPLHVSIPSPRIQDVSSFQEPLMPALTQQIPATEPSLFRYQFREPLIEGIILKKRKRFTADVEVNGQVIVCHCPTTCLSLYQTLLDGQQVRCLISKADPSIKRAKERETQYTLEAISLNGFSSWIGINQSAVTRYIGHYLRAGGLPSICADPTGLKAEQMVGKRRIDFVYQGRDSIEVKMPPPRHMREAALKGKVGGKPYSERMLGQVICMTRWLQEQRAILGLSDKAWDRARHMRRQPDVKDPRAVLLLAYQHQEPAMKLPRRITGTPSPLMVAMREAIKAGLEVWQVNMELDKHGVALRCYFRRHLMRGRPQRHLSFLKGHDYMLDASCALPASALLPMDGGCSRIPDGIQLPASDRLDRSYRETVEGLQDFVEQGLPLIGSSSSSLVHQHEDMHAQLSTLWRPAASSADIVAATQMPVSIQHPELWIGYGEADRELADEELVAATA